LGNIKVKKWKDLVDAFIRQYKFNMDVGPDRSFLQSMKKKQGVDKKKILKGGVRQLHGLILLCWKKMINLFSNTFKAPNFEYLAGSSA